MMRVEQCSFILKYVIRRFQPRGGGETKCTCIIQLGNSFTEKDRWLDIQHVFTYGILKSNDPVMAADWIPEKVHDRNGVKN